MVEEFYLVFPDIHEPELEKKHKDRGGSIDEDNSVIPEIHDPEVLKFRDSIVAALHRNSNVPSFRGGYGSIFQLNNFLRLAKANDIPIAGKRVIDCGCGAARPVGASILLYLLGAASTLAIDLETPFDLSGIAVAEYGNILSVLSGLSLIDQKNAGENLEFARHRAGDFNLAALLKGDLYGGLVPAIRHKISRYQDLPADERKFDLMISYSVFEHVADIADVLACARTAISSEGCIYTAVDFRDHRLYTIGASPWQYLLDDSDYKPGYINKIRFTEMNEIFERTGYTIAACVPLRDKLPTHVSMDILPKYQKVSEIDLETVQAEYILRPR